MPELQPLTFATLTHRLRELHERTQETPLFNPVFQLAQDIDPTYAAAFEAARDAGVEALAYDTKITPEGVILGARVTME